MIEVGKEAPEFLLTDQNNNPVQLSKIKSKFIVLYFYPKDDTPGCTTEAKEFSEKISEFNTLDTSVFGISKDSTLSHEKFCNKYNLSVSLLSDPEMKCIKPYGVWQEKKNYGKTYMGIVRSTYILDQDKKVVEVWKNIRAAGHAAKVLEKVKEIS